VYHLVWSISLQFKCLSCLQHFSANTLTLTFDLCPWQTVDCFISSRRSRAPSCISRFSLYSQYLPSLRFIIKWYAMSMTLTFDIKLLTKNNIIGFFFSSRLSSVLCTKLYDPDFMIWSSSCLQASSTTWCYDLDILPKKSLG
jgi:hypothetical protein